MRDAWARKPLERVFSDGIGPMLQPSIGGSRYFVTVLGSYSGYSRCILSLAKSDAGKAVLEMIRELKILLNGMLHHLVSIH